MIPLKYHLTKNELFHYGKKGMQWGVLHGPPYPINEHNNVTRIRKGTTIKRLSVRDESVAAGHAYVTYLKQDTEHYKGFFGARLKAINKNADVYSVTMKAKEDLVSPSKKQRVDTFLELYKDDPVLRKELGSYHKSDYHYFTPLPKKFYERQYSKLDGKKLEKKGYETFVRSIGGNEYVRDKYFKTLASKGYSFVNDDQDAGRFGKAPSIIFDRTKSTTYEGQTKLSTKEIMDTWTREGTYIKDKKK